MNVKEILVDLTLFNSLINRAIYNQCEIVLFNESNPEKFDIEIADLAKRHADTVTVYKTLEGKTLFASDLHFNPYGVKVIASSINKIVEELKDVMEDKELFSPNGGAIYINRVRQDPDASYDDEIEVKFTVYPSKEKMAEEEDGQKDERTIQSFISFLNSNKYNMEPIARSESLLQDLTDAMDAQNELEESEEYGNAKGILKVIDENIDEVERVYKDYSGRGMYGDKCFGIIVGGYAYNDMMDAFGKMGVGGNSDNMGLDMIIYWPRYSWADMTAADDQDVLVHIKGATEEDEDETEANASTNKATIDCTLYIEEDETDSTTRYSGYIRVDNDKEITCTGTDRGDMEWLYTLGEQLASKLNVEIGDFNYSYDEEAYQEALGVTISRSIGDKVEVTVENDVMTLKAADGHTETIPMLQSQTEASEYALKPLIAELESRGYTVLDEGSHQDMTLYVANSKEEFANDIFLALIFGNEELVDIVDSNYKALYAGKYAEVEEIAKKHEKKDETEAVRMESLAEAGDCYKIIKQPLDASAASFAQQMVFEALESSGGEACESEIKKVIDDKELWGYYQKSNPGTLRRARENPELIKDGLEELIKDGYVTLSDGKSEALHPEQKGGQEIKLRKIAEKYIDEVAKHANTGIVQHAILDAEASDLNKEQISSVRKALVEVGNRNMGNDRIRKEGKEGVIAGSDIAEFAAWLTSDCMALTADYLMDSIGDRNAQETYSFAKAKLEDCLMDFYRNDTNKSNYEEIYKFWEDLIYGQKAFGASEGDDFFTVYLMKEKTPEELQVMCKSVEENFETECAIVDNSAFNVYKLGKLKGNESAKTEVANLIGQSEVLEMA